MKNKILLLIIGITFINCEKRAKFVKDFDEQKDEYQFKRTINEFGKFADSTYVDSINLNTILKFKTIDSKGLVKKVDMSKVIRLYIENWRMKKRNYIQFSKSEILQESFYQFLVKVFGIKYGEK